VAVAMLGHSLTSSVMLLRISKEVSSGSFSFSDKPTW
jgi:hypothetical protein